MTLIKTASVRSGVTVLCTVIVSFIATAALFEWLLVQWDYQPTRRGPGYLYRANGWAELDPVTGWRNREGAAISTEPGNAQMGFWSHGRRATRPTPDIRPGPQVVLLGDSLTQGHGVIDEETYAYIVQARQPEWSIENFGTGGYGGYQSLLTLRKIYATGHFRPRLVVYAFAGSDADRNVADYRWVEVHLNANGEYFAPPSAIATTTALSSIRSRFIGPGRSSTIFGW